MTNDNAQAAPAKRRMVRIGILAVAVGVSALVLVLRPREESVSKVLGATPVAVAPGVYLLGKTAPAAAYLVKTSDGLVLVDSGLEAHAAAILQQFADLRLSVKRVKAILLTHAHADHSLGAERIREISGAKVYAGSGDGPALREGSPREMFFSTFHMPHIEAHKTSVDVELAGDERVVFGDTTFTALATPGHTSGSICYLMERSGLRVLFTGDVVQNLSRPQDGQMGTYAAYLPPVYGGNAKDYLASLRRLRSLPTPDLVLPGHPKMDESPQNPRLSEKNWHALLDVGIAELEKLVARHDADGADFLDGTPRELLPGLHYFGNLGAMAVYCLDTPKALCLFNAPGGDKLVYLVKERFEKLGWKGRKLTAVVLTSADKESTSGIAALVKEANCQVVTPGEGRDVVRALCPAGTKLLHADDLPAIGWFETRTIVLQGRGLGPIAYELRWAGKTVLITGGIPVKFSEPAFDQLQRDVGPRTADFFRSLDELAKCKPDLWLPALPVHGQNANLYERDWDKVIDRNRKAFAW